MLSKSSGCFLIYKTINCLEETSYISFIPGSSKILTSNAVTKSIQIYDIANSALNEDMNNISLKENKFKLGKVITAASEFVNNIPVTAKILRTGDNKLQLEVKFSTL